MKADGGRCLDSLEVSGSLFRRTLAATAVAATCLIFIGCQEDRSNLLPGDSADRIDAEIAKIEKRVAEGLCFEALDAAQSIEEEIDDLGPGLDPKLLKTLQDGVIQLQIRIQDECVDAGATTVEPEVEDAEPVEELVPPSGGTTVPEEDQGEQRPTPAPEPEPEPAPEPTDPPRPTPPDNSGGVSPSAMRAADDV